MLKKIIYYFKRKQVIRNAEYVVFTKDIKTTDMFGCKNIILKGTIGRITDKKVKNTVYGIKYFDNVEVTYGDKQRVLLAKYWRILKPVEGVNHEEFII